MTIHMKEIEAVTFGRDPEDGPVVHLHGTDQSITLLQQRDDGVWQATRMTVPDAEGMTIADLSGEFGTTDELLAVARGLVEDDGSFDPINN